MPKSILHSSQRYGRVGLKTRRGWVSVDACWRSLIYFLVKRRLIFQTLGTCLIVLVLAGCSTTETRIAEHPEIFQHMSPSDQALVRTGGFAKGCRATRSTSPGVRRASEAKGASGESRSKPGFITTPVWAISIRARLPTDLMRASGSDMDTAAGLDISGGYQRFYGGFAYDPFLIRFFTIALPSCAIPNAPSPSKTAA